MQIITLEFKRWFIVVAAIVMQLCLGSVYTWSVFQRPLINTFGWSELSVQITFMVCVATLGFAAAFGGILVDKKNSKFIATVGGVLFGLGTIIAGFAVHVGNIWLLYIGYGFIAGLGNGFCYVTPIAVLIRWFPDKRGLVSGIAVLGFGTGGFIMALIVPEMINSLGIPNVFYIFGGIFLVTIPVAGQFFTEPPKYWIPTGSLSSTSYNSTTYSFVLKEALQTFQWWMLWSMLFFNISAGLGLISQLSPIIQDVLQKVHESSSGSKLTIAAGTILAYASIFNGFGRLFWAWLSDRWSRRAVFLIIFFTQSILYILLPQVSSQWIFTVCVCYLLACFGGGFALMPAFVADTFGSVHIGKIYGTMLSSWGVAAIVGPLIFAQMNAYAFYIAAGMLFSGFILAYTYTIPRK